jgi:hypothetical protein
MTPPTERLAVPELDSAAFATTLAAYQRARRHDVIHEARIARSRLRDVISAFVAEALVADMPKSGVVRRINDRVNALVRSREIEPDTALVAELIEWIVAQYPDELVLDRMGGRPTPVRGRDVIPVQLFRTELAG